MILTLDLAHPGSSDIQFKVSKFPDGQQAVTIEAVPEYEGECTILLLSRLNAFADLELILCATAALRGIGYRKIHLKVPYFLGARSDRKFMDGGHNYLKDVICPIINAQGYESVTVVDPHSDVLEACLNNYRKIDNIDLVRFALGKLQEREKIVLVSPDAGALKKVYHVAETFMLDKIIIAAKHRDIASGKITHTEVPGLDKYSPNSTFVIIDDICDGGRTFIELAKVIKSHVWSGDEYFRGKIVLIVTHGIFSAGFNELGEYFDELYCTNSVSDILPDSVGTNSSGQIIHIRQTNAF